ncbi:hypothetical protein PVK06_014140 [Gossypium arboreum]|uniref:Uncharacterized protein n=1 Tax=Gossypium arboreum TaxID=29729 RepID=A0ABR0PTZ3_GOSAR|nr:hypothetical protein PVK06_014140 [Gossypium arboreum]
MGCRGFLRDDEGNVRALFSGSCDTIDTDSAELGVIITAFDVIIEIGRLWSQQTTFADMERRLACVGEVAFSKAEQHGNEMEEILPSVGVVVNVRLVIRMAGFHNSNRTV